MSRFNVGVLAVTLIALAGCKPSGSDADPALAAASEGLQYCRQAMEEVPNLGPDAREAALAVSCFDWVPDQACREDLTHPPLTTNACFTAYCAPIENSPSGMLVCQAPDFSRSDAMIQRTTAMLTLGAAATAFGASRETVGQATQSLDALFNEISLAAPEMQLQTIARYIESATSDDHPFEMIAGVSVLMGM